MSKNLPDSTDKGARDKREGVVKSVMFLAGA
jgi:hypothetical protein